MVPNLVKEHLLCWNAGRQDIHVREVGNCLVISEGESEPMPPFGGIRGGDVQPTGPTGCTRG